MPPVPVFYFRAGARRLGQEDWGATTGARRLGRDGWGKKAKHKIKETVDSDALLALKSLVTVLVIMAIDTLDLFGFGDAADRQGERNFQTATQALTSLTRQTDNTIADEIPVLRYSDRDAERLGWPIPVTAAGHSGGNWGAKRIGTIIRKACDQIGQ